jgi:iron(III)-enterobactin esterase
MDLEEHELISASGEYSRKVWISREQTDQPRRLCVILDAEFYLGRIGATTTIDRLREAGQLPPLTFVFVSHGDNEARHYDYTCNTRYSRFLAREVVQWAQQTDPFIDTQPFAVCGASLSGLAAAYLCVAYPEIFTDAICQSGSFWWNNEWYAKLVRSRAPLTGKFWLSVGDKETALGLTHAPTGMKQEIAQSEAVIHASEALREAGADVHFRKFQGGHDHLRWKEDLPEALRWLLNSAAAPAYSADMLNADAAP